MCVVHVLTRVHIESPFQCEDIHDGLYELMFRSDGYVKGKIRETILFALFTFQMCHRFLISSYFSFRARVRACFIESSVFGKLYGTKFEF